MFTLICEKCRREYPLSKGNCPYCAASSEADAPSMPVEVGTLHAAAPAPTAAAAAPRPEPIARPQAMPVPRPQVLPTWLMSIVFTLAFGGLLAGAYFVIEYFKNEPSAAAPDSAVALETPAVSGSSAASLSANPYLKYLEVTGLRLTQNRSQKTQVRFLVVNHSGAEIPDLAGSLHLVPKGGGEPLGRVTLKVAGMGPYESREVEAIVDTKLKVYELPDWQKLDAMLELK